MAGIERCRGQRCHRFEIAFEALADALAMPAKNVALALAAALFQVLVERFEACKARRRNHEVAPRPTHQTLHRPLVVAFAGAPVPVPDEVVREESAEKLCAPARPVTLDPRHKTPIVVVEHRQRHRAEERERVHVSVDPCLGRRRGVRPNVRCVAVRQVEGEEMDFLLDPANERPCFAEISLPMPRRMNQRHVHLPAPAMMLAHVVLHDRVPPVKPCSPLRRSPSWRCGRRWPRARRSTPPASPESRDSSRYGRCRALPSVRASS